MNGRALTKIILHCSDSSWGNAAEIDSWHRQKGWNGIGYHYVITNGRPKSGQEYSYLQDGVVEKGRDEGVIGAHARGHNRDSLGICLIGTDYLFTVAQLRKALFLVNRLRTKYTIPIEQVFGHYQFDETKTCPMFRIEDFRALLRGPQ